MGALPACARSRSRTSESHEFSHAKIDIQCTRNSANFAEAIQSILAYEKLPSRAPPTNDSSLSMDNEREIHQLADQSNRNSEIPLKAEQPTWSRLTWRYCARECMQRAAKASSMEGARQSDGRRRNYLQIEFLSTHVYTINGASVEKKCTDAPRRVSCKKCLEQRTLLITSPSRPGAHCLLCPTPASMRRRRSRSVSPSGRPARSPDPA